METERRTRCDAGSSHRSACFGRPLDRWRRILPTVIVLGVCVAGPTAADGPPDTPDVRGINGVSKADELREISTVMREIGQRLLHGQVSARTQQEQGRVVERLDELIQRLGQEKAGASASDTTKSSAKNGAGKSPREGGQKAARDGSAAQSQADSIEPLKMMQQGAGQAWGQLPERMRRQMQDAATIEFLPQFRQLIEDYYRRLAERDR